MKIGGLFVRPFARCVNPFAIDLITLSQPSPLKGEGLYPLNLRKNLLKLIPYLPQKLFSVGFVPGCLCTLWREAVDHPQDSVTLR